MKRNTVGVSCEGDLRVHLPNHNGNYYTLCGLDGDDPDYSTQQTKSFPSDGEKVTCSSCYQMWKVCREFSMKDFNLSECLL